MSKKPYLKNKLYTLTLALVVGIVFFALPFHVHAETGTHGLASKNYESMDASDGYASFSESSVSVFSYGKSSLGSLTLYGSTNQENTLNGYNAYAVLDYLSVGYSYDGSFQTKTKEDWNLISDSGKTVNGISVSKKIEDGVFIIQKSTDGVNWENASDPIYNFFSAKKLDYSKLYTATDEELKDGTYFRITIAYEMGRKTGENPGSISPPRLPSDIYEYVYCSEIYEFYACYGTSLLSLRDLPSGEDISSGTVVEQGFIVDKNGSSNSVTVQRDTNASVTVNSMTSFTDTGKYTITVMTHLNQKYVYYVEVSGGLKTVKLSPQVYQNEKKDEYTLENSITGNTAFSLDSHTQLTIGQNSGKAIAKATHDGFDAYGITGNSVSIYLQLKGMSSLTSNGWEIATDTWGKKDSQNVAGIYAGQVNSGALILQTSTDGSDWRDVDKDRYADGLYTTDYESYYGDRGDVLIYTPDGEAILNGVYIRILYAYEIKNSAAKADYRIIEEYRFYLCSNELNAVTFHNLSLGNQVTEICEGYDEATAQIDQHQQAETMLTNAYTVSGFKIDNSLNPTVSYTATRNGVIYSIPSNNKITSTGKYTIHLTSAVNSTRDVTIYVDRMTTDEALEFYFGDSFIIGKRIYSEGEYAVYEGGKTSYQIQAVDEYHLPVSGQITNITTGDTIEISATRNKKSGILTTPGTYEAVLSTNPNFESENSSGDCRTFIFHFEVIQEGTAPGPVVNQGNLADYAATTITDSYPKYYGLTFSSASKGTITLAFATKEAALAYAKTYEQGMVETQSDGSYRYTGSFITKQKEKFDSNWDLMDAIDFFAEQAVQELYFDLSDEFTVTTLPDAILEDTDNLRTLELNSSVVIFADGQKASLTALESLPIISAKPYHYLSPGTSGTVSSGYEDFEFIKDKYGCDSYSVKIKDINGKEYSIRYNSGVGEKLSAAGCPSGKITIIESTIYGDSTEYEAVFIADGENQTQITLSYYVDGEENIRTINQGNSGNSVDAEAFSICGITDSLDPYSLVIVSHENTQRSYIADQIPKDAWSDPGKYTIKAVNRLGFSYSFTINVIESDFATITFEGEGTESTGYILTKYGDQHIKLPEIIRYGYTLSGFEDEEGTLYNDEIAAVHFRGASVLTAVWEPKQYTLSLQDSEGNAISTMTVDFGRSYELPIPSLGDGYEFVRWEHNGVPLETSTFTLNDESDVTLVAVARQVETDDNPAEITQQPTSSSGLGMIAIILLAVIGGIVLVLVKKRRSSCPVQELSGDEEDNDEQ